MKCKHCGRTIRKATFATYWVHVWSGVTFCESFKFAVAEPEPEEKGK